MSVTEPDWVEEARRRADAKHTARQARFMADDDDDPKDPEILLLPVGSKVEGLVQDLSEIDGQFGPTVLATIETQDQGVLKVLAGPKILSDLFAVVGVGDFVSLVWNGKRSTKDGSTSYRHWSVAHVPAPGSGREAHAPIPTPRAQDALPGMGTIGDDDDPL